MSYRERVRLAGVLSPYHASQDYNRPGNSLASVGLSLRTTVTSVRAFSGKDLIPPTIRFDLLANADVDKDVI